MGVDYSGCLKSKVGKDKLLTEAIQNKIAAVENVWNGAILRELLFF